MSKPVKKDIAAGRMKKFYIRSGIFVLLFFIAAMSTYFSYTYVVEVVNRDNSEIKMTFSENESIKVDIPMGSGTDKIAEILYEKDIIKNQKLFKVLSKINGYDGHYQSGTHVIGSNISYESLRGYDDLMRIMTSLPVANPTITVTIPEGYNYKQIVELLVKKDLVTEQSFDKAANEADFDFEFLKDIPERENRLEGYLFPDTYIFDVQGGAEHIIFKMLSRFNEVFKEEYREKAEKLGMTTDEIITLASIIEREAQVAEDRPIISGVFYNRLKSSDGSLNRLQSCATIQYIFYMKDGTIKEQITTADTEVEHLYNTYQHAGLPPGPISSPGEAAIRAALYPDDTEYFYFVAKGDGSHYFSKTYNEHVNAMNRFGQILD